MKWKVTKLPRNGPKDGQTYKQWAYGKSFGDQDWQKKVDTELDEFGRPISQPRKGRKR